MGTFEGLCPLKKTRKKQFPPPSVNLTIMQWGKKQKPDIQKPESAEISRLEAPVFRHKYSRAPKTERLGGFDSDIVF